MKRKHMMAIAVVSCLAVVAGFAVIRQASSPKNDGTMEKQLAGPSLIRDGETDDGGYAMGGGPSLPGSDEADRFVVAAVERLWKDFGKGPLGKAAQIQLAGLRNYLKDQNPETYQALFKAIVSRAFPAQAGEILKTIETLDIYSAWLEDNKERLSRLGHDEIKQELWAKRKALFGNAAREMWAEETRTEAVSDVLDIMRDAYDTRISDKLALYTEAIAQISKDTHGDGSGPDFIEDRKVSLTRAFLGLDSVQAELSAMDGNRRAEALRTIRKTMGFSESELDTLAQKDAANELKWQNGYAYMRDRNRLLAEPDDGTQAMKLSALQERYFKNAASTIQAEEASGFLRFNRPRVFGRN